MKHSNHKSLDVRGEGAAAAVKQIVRRDVPQGATDSIAASACPGAEDEGGKTAQRKVLAKRTPLLLPRFVGT